MSAITFTAPACASIGALRNGRAQRSVVRPVAVAIPRRSAAARPVARTEKATLAAMPVTAPAEVATAPQRIVHTLDAESYHVFLEQHSDKVVTIDFYAVWCGPCKMIAPELERMAADSDPTKLVFAKLDCGASNETKRLAMSLGIKALPTFHVHRNGKLVDTMTGAKVKSLQELIAKHV